MPETFSSEIRHVHERRDDRASFNDEFRGASDSLIEHDRPPRPIDVARRPRRVLLVIVLIAAVLGGGGWALWYWSEPIGEWIASWNPGEEAPPEPAPVEAVEPAQPEPEPEPSEPEPSEPPRVFGIKGAPAGSEAASDERPSTPSGDPPLPSEPGELPVESLDAPKTEAVSVSLASSSVRGKVASTSVNSRLAPVDAALEACWASAVGSPGTKRPATVTLRFTIKWNGRTHGLAVDGDVPKSIVQCVRDAVPSSGWPQPSDGGEATVTRSWSLE